MMGNKFNSFLRPTSVLLLAGVLTFAVTSLLFSTPTAAESTRMHGGVGGEWFTRQCPAGQFLVRFNGSTGLYVDEITPWCAVVKNNRWRDRDKIAIALVGGGGGTASGEQPLCATNRLIGSLRVGRTINLLPGASGNVFVATIDALCVPIRGRGGPLTGAQLHSSITGNQDVKTLSCPRGQFATGISGRSGFYIDAIRLDCAPISGPYAEDTLIEVGGAGGEAAVSVCPGSKRMIGLISRVENSLLFGTWIKGLRPICGEMSTWPRGLTVPLMRTGHAGPLALAPNVGARDGDKDTLYCGDNQYVEAIDTHHKRFVNSVKLRCRKIDYASSGESRRSGIPEGDRDLLQCPGDMVAAGIVVRAGTAIDSLRLRCKRDSNPGNHLIAIIGDSFASGEGAPDLKVTGGPLPEDESTGDRKWRAGWSDRPCHRSNFAGTTLAAKELVKRSKGSIVFRNFACSGATVAGLVGRQQVTAENKAVIDPQLQTAARWMRSRGKARLDTLIVGIGGNDAGFGSRITDCAIPEAIENFSFGLLAGSCGNDPRFLDKIQEGLDTLYGEEGAYATLENELRSRVSGVPLNPRTVLIRTMPNPITANRGPPPLYCGNYRDSGPRPGGILSAEEFLYNTLGGIDDQAMRVIDIEFILEINIAIRAAASLHGWSVIEGWYGATLGGGYCTSDGTRLFNLPSDTHELQGNFSGVFHPNKEGYAKEKNFIVDTVSRARVETRAKELAKAKALLAVARLSKPSKAAAAARPAQPAL